MDELLMWQIIAVALGLCLAYTMFTTKQTIEDYIKAFTTNECVEYFYSARLSVNETQVIEWNTTR